MIEINCDTISKRFQFEWIFKNFNYNFTQQNSYAVLGNNGSGKSTLLMLLSGYILPSGGNMEWKKNDQLIEAENRYRHLSFASPALELIEEFSLKEMIAFQKTFKPFIHNFGSQEIADVIGLSHSNQKPIKNFSSGMRQRVKLALAMLAQSDVVFLDEPTTNLDEAGVRWYLNLIESYSNNRLLIVASNMEREYSFCNVQLQISNWK